MISQGWNRTTPHLILVAEVGSHSNDDKSCAICKSMPYSQRCFCGMHEVSEFNTINNSSDWSEIFSPEHDSKSTEMCVKKFFEDLICFDVNDYGYGFSDEIQLIKKNIFVYFAFYVSKHTIDENQRLCLDLLSIIKKEYMHSNGSRKKYLRRFKPFFLDYFATFQNELPDTISKGYIHLFPHDYDKIESFGDKTSLDHLIDTFDERNWFEKFSYYNTFEELSLSSQEDTSIVEKLINPFSSFYDLLYEKDLDSNHNFNFEHIEILCRFPTYHPILYTPLVELVNFVGYDDYIEEYIRTGRLHFDFPVAEFIDYYLSNIL